MIRLLSTRASQRRSTRVYAGHEQPHTFAQVLARQTTVVVAESDQLMVKPRGKWVVYTEDSYRENHGNRSPQDDGYTLEPICLKEGHLAQGVRVWEGPKDVWEIEASGRDIRTCIILAVAEWFSWWVRPLRRDRERERECERVLDASQAQGAEAPPGP